MKLNYWFSASCSSTSMRDKLHEAPVLETEKLFGRRQSLFTVFKSVGKKVNEPGILQIEAHISFNLQSFQIVPRKVFQFQSASAKLHELIPVRSSKPVVSFSLFCHLVDFRSRMGHHDSHGDDIGVGLHDKIDGILNRLSGFVRMADYVAARDFESRLLRHLDRLLHLLELYSFPYEIQDLLVSRFDSELNFDASRLFEFGEDVLIDPVNTGLRDPSDPAVKPVVYHQIQQAMRSFPIEGEGFIQEIDLVHVKGFQYPLDLTHNALGRSFPLLLTEDGHAESAVMGAPPGREHVVEGRTFRVLMPGRKRKTIQILYPIPIGVGYDGPVPAEQDPLDIVERLARRNGLHQIEDGEFPFAVNQDIKFLEFLECPIRDRNRVRTTNYGRTIRQDSFCLGSYGCRIVDLRGHGANAHDIGFFFRQPSK